jgi:hypothetical protein
LNTRQEVHAAIAHFAANRDEYPPRVRRMIAARIRRRAAELGIATPSLARLAAEGGDTVRHHPPKGRVPPQLRPYLFRPGHRPRPTRRHRRRR